MSAVDDAVLVMSQAKREILRLREALVSVRRSGTRDEPCYCNFSRLSPSHSPNCTIARELLGCEDVPRGTLDNTSTETLMMRAERLEAMNAD